MKQTGHSAGYSLAEALVVIAAIGILAGIAIVGISGTRGAAGASVAKGNLNILNGAVTAMNNTGQELVLNPAPDASDELAVFTALQSRDANNPVPGSPFLPADLRFVAGAETNINRAMWNGRYFQLVPEGAPGTGIDLQSMNPQ